MPTKLRVGRRGVCSGAGGAQQRGLTVNCATSIAPHRLQGPTVWGPRWLACALISFPFAMPETRPMHLPVLLCALLRRLGSWSSDAAGHGTPIRGPGIVAAVPVIACTAAAPGAIVVETATSVSASSRAAYASRMSCCCPSRVIANIQTLVSFVLLIIGVNCPIPH